MIKPRWYTLILPWVIAVSVGSILIAQETPAPAPQPAAVPEKVFTVNGKEMPGAVVQLGGRYFVSVDTLAQITNGTISIDPSRIALTIPTPPAGSASTAAPAEDVLTRAFSREAVSTLADTREWKAAMATVVSFGVPVVGTWPNDYSNRVQDDLTRTKLAAMSNSDFSALGLLQSEDSNLASWSGDVVSSRAALNAARSVDPNALQNDALYRKIDGCSQFLNSMIGSGVFSDDPRCH